MLTSAGHVPSSCREPRSITDRLAPVFAGLLIIFNVALTIRWIRTDRMPPFWDAAWYLHNGAMQYDALRQKGLFAFYIAWVGLDQFRPCFASTLTIPFYAISGVSNDSGLLVNLCMSVALLVAVYFLGRSAWDNSTALLAMAIIGGYPLIIGLTHVFLVELTKTAIIAGSLLALWKSEGFRRRNWSLTSALFLASGCVTKVVFPLFIAGPWVVALVKGLRGPGESRCRLSRNQAFNLALTILLPLFIGAAWYVPNFQLMWARSVSASIGEESALYGPENPIRWESISAYLNEFIGQDASVWAFTLFLLALCGFLWAGVQRCFLSRSGDGLSFWVPAFTMSSFLPAYMFLNSLRNQDHNHVSGILPALAVFTAWGLRALLGRFTFLMTPLVFCISAVQAVAGTDPALFKALRIEPLQTRNCGRLILLYTAQPPLVNPRYAAPERSDWHIEDVIRWTLHSIPSELREGHPPRVGIIPNFPGIDESGLLFAARCAGVPMRLEFAAPQELCEYDALIGKSGDQGFPNRAAEIDEINRLLAQPDSCFFDTTCPIRLPDGSTVVVHVNRATSTASQPDEPR